jgi:hypothetical protein
MNRKDPMLKLALQLHQRLVPRQHLPQRERQRQWINVREQAELLLRRLSRCQVAEQRSWSTAASITETAAVDALHQLRHVIDSASPQLELRKSPPPIALRDLYQELDQLETEFGSSTLDPKQKVIAVVTDPIELEDVQLGPFRIELHVDRLRFQVNVSVFDLVALQPNPPDCSEYVTHPHVRDRQLCAGDATVPISRALESGRITDAFLAVRAVLETYNESSPYVALVDWHGQPCGDCGSNVIEDDGYSCEQCGQVCCDQCIGRCDICDSSFCRSCLEEDTQSGRSCCRSCRYRCGACHRVVDADSFNQDTELCPECHEEQIQQQEQENDDDEKLTPPAEPPDPGSPAASPPRVPDAA